VSLVPSPAEAVDRFQLGPDALRDAKDFQTFRDAVAGGRGTIKSALMNQEKLAGVGNVYSDEILYQAHLHPKTGVDGLDGKQLRRLHRCMIRVLETTIQRRADVSQVPRTWLLPHRQEGEPCRRCGRTLTRATIAGRTSYVCENCQKLPKKKK
jgi:formamidopyrimidine-DNA glycosylase